jgi:hypothetical protein
MQLKVDKQPTLVRGTLTWTGAPRLGPSDLVLIAGLAGLVLTALALGLWMRSLRRRRPRAGAQTAVEPGRVVLDRLPPEKAPPARRFEKTIYPSVSARN